MIRRIAASLLCLVLLASLCPVWASEETTEPAFSGQKVHITTRTRVDRGDEDEVTSITVEMEGWPGFFSGLVVGAGIGAVVASACVIACSNMIHKRKERHKCQDT